MRKQRIYRLNPPDDGLDETPLLPEARLHDPTNGAGSGDVDADLDAALQRLAHAERDAEGHEGSDSSS